MVTTSKGVSREAVSTEGMSLNNNCGVADALLVCSSLAIPGWLFLCVVECWWARWSIADLCMFL